MLNLPRNFAGQFTTVHNQVTLPADGNILVAEANVNRVLLVLSTVASFGDVAHFAPYVMTAAEQGLIESEVSQQNLILPFRDWGGVLLDAWYGWGPFSLLTVNVMSVEWTTTN